MYLALTDLKTILCVAEPWDVNTERTYEVLSSKEDWVYSIWTYLYPSPVIIGSHVSSHIEDTGHKID